MTTQLTATWRNGAFVPDAPLELADESRVVISVEHAVSPPLVADVQERRRILNALIERMKTNPLPPAARRFSRDELHDRR